MSYSYSTYIPCTSEPFDVRLVSTPTTILQGGKFVLCCFFKKVVLLSKMFTNCHVLMRWCHYLSSKSDNVQGMMVMSDGLPDANRDPNSNNITFAVLTRLLF